MTVPGLRLGYLEIFNCVAKVNQFPFYLCLSADLYNITKPYKLIFMEFLYAVSLAMLTNSIYTGSIICEQIKPFLGD